MTRAGAAWVGGLVGSVLAHGILAGGLVLALRPDPVTEQPMPQSELDVQAYALERTAAREEPAQSTPAAAAQADGSAVAAGAIPQSTARPVDMAATALDSLSAPVAPLQADPAEVPSAAALAVPAEGLAPQQAEAVALSGVPVAGQAAAPVVATPAALGAAVVATAPISAALPTTSVLPARVAPATSLGAQPGPALAVPAAATPSATVTLVRGGVEAVAAASPETAAIPVATGSGTVLDPTRTAPASAPAVIALAAPAALATPDREAAPAQTLPSTPAPAAADRAERLTADLAFAGDMDDEVDPVSLAAFQSFMRPGDVAEASGNSLRDGVSALLAQVPCSRLQVGFDPDTATLSVNGHIPEDGLRGPVLAALAAQMGSDITVSDNILILPRPQCGALGGIGDVGLPQSTDRFNNPRVIGADTHVKVERFVAGQFLSFDLTAPDYDAYVYVDYFDAGGNVVHLVPNEQVALARSAAQSVFRIGIRDDSERGLKILIGPPFGQEIAVAFASSRPLYDELRPLVEPAAPYLEWLKGRVAQVKAEDPTLKGEWIYFFISTAER